MKPEEQKDVIIDLFSGGESYRATVESAGCVHVRTSWYQNHIRRRRGTAKEAATYHKRGVESHSTDKSRTYDWGAEPNWGRLRQQLNRNRSLMESKQKNKGTMAVTRAQTSVARRTQLRYRTVALSNQQRGTQCQAETMKTELRKERAQNAEATIPNWQCKQIAQYWQKQGIWESASKCWFTWFECRCANTNAHQGSRLKDRCVGTCPYNVNVISQKNWEKSINTSRQATTVTEIYTSTEEKAQPWAQPRIWMYAVYKSLRARIKCRHEQTTACPTSLRGGECQSTIWLISTCCCCKSSWLILKDYLARLHNDVHLLVLHNRFSYRSGFSRITARNEAESNDQLLLGSNSRN